MVKKSEKEQTIFEMFVEKFGLNDSLSAYFRCVPEVRRFLADTEAAFEKDPKLRKAVQSEHGAQSACVAVKAAAAVGLSLNPAMRECYLSVFKNNRKSGQNGDVYDVAFVKQKYGYIRKALDTGNIRIMASGLVYKNDTVTFKQTLEGDVFDIEPDLDDRGAVRGAFAKMKTKSGEKSAVYMSIKDMEHYRETWHAQKYNGKYVKPMWWDPKTFPLMGEKTCLKHLCEKNNIPTGELPPEIQEEFDELGVQREYIDDVTVSPSDEIAADMEQENEQANDNGRDLF